jgi:pectin methylesterase-like acyl-CoA thioesterase
MEEPMIRKKKLLRTITIVAAGLCTCLFGQMSRASTVQVGGCKTGLTNFPTISAAVTAVPSGSIIEVCPGTYPEQVVINKNLTLDGIASGTMDAPTIVPPNGGLVANTTDPANIPKPT